MLTTFLCVFPKIKQIFFFLNQNQNSEECLVQFFSPAPNHILSMADTVDLNGCSADVKDIQPEKPSIPHLSQPQACQHVSLLSENLQSFNGGTEPQRTTRLSEQSPEQSGKLANEMIPSSSSALFEQSHSGDSKLCLAVKNEIRGLSPSRPDGHSSNSQSHLCSSTNNFSLAPHGSTGPSRGSSQHSPAETLQQESGPSQRDQMSFSQTEFLRTRLAYAKRVKPDGMKGSAQKSTEVAKAIHDFEESVEQRCAALPLAAQPSLIVTPLFPHRRQALYWELKQESERKIGGLLCDQMGLGKTIEMISLIAERPRPKGAFGTLVIAPSMGLLHWRDEIKRHTDGAISTVIIHASNGTTQMPHESLLLYDVVITSYGVIIRSELLKKIVWCVILLILYEFRAHGERR